MARNHGYLRIIFSQTAYTTTASATESSVSKSAALSIYKVRVSCICSSHVQIDMLTGVKSVPGMSAIKAAYFTETTTRILYSGRAHHSLVPALVGFARWVPVLPIWMRVWAQDISAIAFKDVKALGPFEKSDEGVNQILHE
ncbi:hypothetical protein BKA56DRAFT_623344 [Ilyonectria sp. MPI-CAGE-AT-0026]|nr:hypothetical protein BKA56DRAFT_623344 [Ilyonectria sp. MPI-CAGE-AT-0026]